jgi:hypothetical protein
MLCQFGNVGLVQPVVFEGSLLSFRHGNIFPGHGLYLPHLEIVTDVLRICVTDILIFWNLCLLKVHICCQWGIEQPYSNQKSIATAPSDKNSIGPRYTQQIGFLD